jgi:hypothetical protein
MKLKSLGPVGASRLVSRFFIALSRQVLPRGKAPDKFHTGVGYEVGELHRKILLVSISAGNGEIHAFNVLIDEETILDGIGDEKITSWSDYEYSLIGRSEQLKKSPFKLTVAVVQDTQVVLVHPHRYAIDLPLLIVSSVTVRA